MRGWYATAVQFTRNPDGIAGALKRIGGLQQGSKVENPGAPEISHAFFAQGVSGFMQALSATHPPLAKRIRRIDPQWDGKFDHSDASDRLRGKQKARKTESVTRGQLADKAAAVAVGAAVVDVMNAIDQIGNPKQETINYARALISELPAAIKEAAREPYGARAVMYSLVLDQGQEVRNKQLERLRERADPDVYTLTLQLMSEMGGLETRYRLPLIDIAMPALKQLSISQYKSFRFNLLALIGAFLGWQGVLVALLGGALAGAFVGLSLMAVRKLDLASKLPFGSFLAVGALVALFSRGRLVEAYLSLL